MNMVGVRERFSNFSTALSSEYETGGAKIHFVGKCAPLRILRQRCRGIRRLELYNEVRPRVPGVFAPEPGGAACGGAASGRRAAGGRADVPRRRPPLHLPLPGLRHL